ncbi:uncharacterized protein N7496_000760 [Penicillium cataractarum]|uniref:DUF1907 domain-containing protein n=1 Tax=Penicillium cataractarum TaxID=2100454 RepID=A0A9X0B6F1_9EURO|nr:uncharacterized protein N7496_000760 [Penicillium cataractarum]KAJ5389692.1 hypothetical protein N7496_000760 [Penicillium cataractarum]
MTVTTHPRDPPPLGELAAIIQRSLLANFASASVSVVECPDLRQPPFHLASSGLSGNPCIADVGGQANLFPRPNFDAKFDLRSLAKDMQMTEGEGGFLIGAGAAPFHDTGYNAELAVNLYTPPGPHVGTSDPDIDQVRNGTRIIQVNKDGSPCCEPIGSLNCGLMVNLFGSTGDTGPVLKITARARTGDKNFTHCIRLGLADHYGDSRPISLGGVFLLKAGKAKFHIMPDFPKEENLPFRDREQLEKNWLTYHDFGAPVICLTVMHSSDPEGLGLRMEHTHCFEVDGNRKGGHYHYDLQDEGEEVEYEAYLNVASTIYRIDRPGA